jgi:serine/threonine protein kinase
VLCDLGLARGCNFETNVDKKLEKVTRLSTNYVQTRPYRAPELILNSSYVGKSTDIWAVGCILAEMLNHGQILFNGATNQEQICCIIQLMGTPPPQEIHGSQAAHEFIKKLEYIQPNDEWYLEVFPRHAIDPLALDLMTRLLAFDHNKRITAEKALEHEFFASYKNAPMKPPTRKFNFDFEKCLMVKTEEEIVTYGNLVKKECYDTILRFHGLLDKEPVAGEDVPKKKSTFLQKMKKILKK